MPTLANGWAISVERGPSCLYLRPHPPVSEVIQESEHSFEPIQLEDSVLAAEELQFLGKGFAELAWELMSQHLTFRAVVEMDHIDSASSELVEELLWLFDQVEAQDGIIRLCGLSAAVRAELAKSDLGRATDLGLNSRDEALMAGRAGRPR